MSDLRDLPQAEFEVMDVLWARGEATAREVQSELAKKRRTLAKNTVGTLLARLREKGYVEAEERDFAYLFRPTVPREQVVRRKLDDLVSQVLGGDLGPLTLYIADKRRLTPQGLAALEELLRSESEKEEG